MERLQKALSDSAQLIENALLEYVREYGQDYHNDGDGLNANGNQYNKWENEMDIKEHDGERITKILDLYSWYGCEITTQQILNPESSYGIDDIFETQVIHALYIIEHDGVEKLNFYALFNGGVVYDENESEPYHAQINDLDTDALVLLAATIIHSEIN